MRSEIYQLQVECDRLADEVDQWSDPRGNNLIMSSFSIQIFTLFQILFFFSTVGRNERNVLSTYLHGSAFAIEVCQLQSTTSAKPATRLATGIEW